MEEISIDDKPSSGYVTFKSYAALLLIFILVMSDPFIDNVLPCFGANTIKNGKVSAWGIILQGILMIVFYILCLSLIEKNIL